MFRTIDDELDTVVVVRPGTKANTPPPLAFAAPLVWSRRIQGLVVAFCLALVWLGSIVSERETVLARIEARQQSIEAMRTRPESLGRVPVRTSLREGT